MRRLLLTMACLLTVASVSTAQTVQNPRTLLFESPDHAAATAYEVDIIRTADNVVIQTITVAKADTTVSGADVSVSVNVQPITFGSYVFRARTRVDAVVSVTSDPSPVWQRAPGKPTNLRVPGDE